MNKMVWYKRDPHAALDGMMILTLEERGAYNTILDLIYARAGEVPDDDRFLAGWMRVDLRVWRRIKARLLELEKIAIEGGKITNSRATYEVLRALGRGLSARQAGLSSARSRDEKRNEIKQTVATKSQRTPQPSKNIDMKTPTLPLGLTESQKQKDQFVVTVGQPTLAAIDDWPADYVARFWARFPRRVAKAAAEKALLKARKRVSFEIMMAGVERYRVAVVGSEFIKHPATWLNADCWKDEHKPRQAAASKNGFGRMLDAMEGGAGPHADELDDQGFIIEHDPRERTP